MEFDYVSMGRGGFVPINVKPTETTQLGNRSM
jgi:hypothetical protein